MIDPASGAPPRDELGKVQYSNPIRWMTNAIAARFSERAIALLLEHEPHALDGGDGA